MVDEGRREARLLSGLGVQVAVIAFLALLFSNAGRKLQAQQELYIKLKEQLVSAQIKVAKQGRFDLVSLKKEVASLSSTLVRPEELPGWAKRIEGLARSPFGFRDLQVRVGSPARTIRVSTSGKESFEIQMVPLELEATTTTHNGAAFLKTVHSSDLKILCPLEQIEMKAMDSGHANPIEIRLTWWIAAAAAPPAGQPSAPAPAAPRGASAPAPPVPAAPPDLKTPWPSPKAALDWGIREEPFDSPISNPSVLRIPNSWRRQFKLSGIVRDQPALRSVEGPPASPQGGIAQPQPQGVPTCVINGIVLKAGDFIQGYRVVLIAPKAVLLQKESEEILLTSP